MAWYQVKGNEQDVVFSSRIRFARNMEGYPFGTYLATEDAKKIISLVADALGESFKQKNMEDLSPLATEALVEQHLISRDFATHKGPHALFCDDNKSVSVMCCEEDHIRLQCILPGLSLRDAYRFACECDDMLDAALPIAFDEKLGYLTHCPTNLGTGLRASVMLFLPALTEHGIVGIGLTSYKSVRIRNVCGVYNVVHGCARVTVCDVIEYGIAEHHRLLLYVAYLRAVSRKVKVLDIMSVDKDFSRISVVESHKQVDEGGFT